QFTLRDARRTLGRAYPGRFKEETIRLGLEELARSLLAREWSRDDGAALKIDLMLVDRGYVRPVVETVCRRVGSPMMPALGHAVKATAKPLSEYQRRPGQTLGHYWWIPSPRGSGEMRHVRTDVNYWKSFIHARLAAGIADAGSLTFWGKAADHRLIADHLTAEDPRHVHARHTVIEWHDKPAHPDNHWFDCLVGCAAAASMVGVRLPGVAPLRRRSQRKKRRRITYLEGDRT
ncbi:MAG TPA: terminase gpA endonuclease subunit, partial [Phycisphaerae bacterium]|nr:terminase gpA endonuclease subunit [Phycisphaerae bacterium]